MLPILFLSLSSLLIANSILALFSLSFSERRKTERGRESPGLALLAGADICQERELFCTSWQEVKARKLKCSFLVMEYLAIFNNVF